MQPIEPSSNQQFYQEPKVHPVQFPQIKQEKNYNPQQQQSHTFGNHQSNFQHQIQQHFGLSSGQSLFNAQQNKNNANNLESFKNLVPNMASNQIIGNNFQLNLMSHFLNKQTQQQQQHQNQQQQQQDNYQQK